MRLYLFPWLALLLGLALPSFLPICPDWRLCLTPLVLIAPGWRSLPERPRAVLIIVAAMLIGAAYSSWRAEWRTSELLASEWEGKPVEFSGVVRGLPDAREWGTRFTLEVESVATPGARLPHTVLLSDFKGAEWPAGSRWKLSASLKRPHGTLNPAGFDAEAWYWADGILATGNVRKGREPLGMAHDLAAYVDRLRAATLARWQTALGETPEAALCAALTVGAQQALPPEVWTQLSRTGLTHLVSVSGVHVTLLAGLIATGLTRLVRRRASSRWPPRLLGALVGLLAAFIYAVLAGYTVPTQRSLYMLAAVVAMLALRRAVSVLQIWLAALTTVLLLDPFSVLAPGFWLSFGLVGLLLMSGTGRRAPAGKVASTVGGQWSATLGSVAPLAGFFGALPLISPAANAVAIPLVSAVLTPLALVALLLPFDFGLHIAGWLARQCLAGLAILADTPAFNLPALPWPLLLLAGLGTLWALLPRGVPGRALGLACLVPLLLYSPVRPNTGEFNATMIDVGQGAALLLETAGHTLLFDTGAGEAGRTLVPVLQARGAGPLDRLVLSHHDNDHDGAAASLLAGWPVREVWLSQLESVEESRQATAQRCFAGTSWHWDGVMFSWLAPFGDEEGDDNAKSCVLRVQAANGASLLVAGDLPAAGEARLLASYPATQLKSTVLVAPHHGSATSSSEEFLATVQPAVAWISAGYRNRYRHPHPRVLQRYQAQGATLWRTDLDGAVSASSSQLDQAVSERQRQARFWRWTRLPPEQR